MSAPALTPRPVVRPAPGRPPTARTAQARSPQARPGQARSTKARSGDARPTQARSTQARSTQARSGNARSAQGTSVPGGSAAQGRVAAGLGAAATAAALRVSALPSRAEARPRMRVVERPDLAPRRAGFVVACTALLGALMLGLLLLNVAISGNAFTLAELQSQRGLLVDRQQALEQELLLQSSPGAVAEAAGQLGMVPAPQTIVLAPDGTGAPPVVVED